MQLRQDHDALFPEASGGRRRSGHRATMTQISLSRPGSAAPGVKVELLISGNAEELRGNPQEGDAA